MRILARPFVTVLLLQNMLVCVDAKSNLARDDLDQLEDARNRLSTPLGQAYAIRWQEQCGSPEKLDKARSNARPSLVLDSQACGIPEDGCDIFIPNMPALVGQCLSLIVQYNTMGREEMEIEQNLHGIIESRSGTRISLLMLALRTERLGSKRQRYVSSLRDYRQRLRAEMESRNTLSVHWPFRRSLDTTALQKELARVQGQELAILMAPQCRNVSQILREVASGDSERPGLSKYEKGPIAEALGTLIEAYERLLVG
jgi:hypothetical protein